MVRAGLQTALAGQGIRDIAICRDVEQLRTHMEDEIVDIVICDVDVAGASFLEFSQGMRQFRWGLNPFALLIATAGAGTADDMRVGLNGGSDSLLRKPLPMGALTNRLQSLIEQRERFIATGDYVGPNRRAKPRPQIAAAPREVRTGFAAPNTLREKILGTATQDHLERLILTGWDCVQREQDRIRSATVAGLVERILAYYDGLTGLRSHLYDLHRLADLCAAVRGTRADPNDPVVTIAAALASVAKLIMRQPEAPSSKLLHLLPPLGEVIQQIMQERQIPPDVLGRIAQEVARFPGIGETG
jgi:DNA-binding response OmpR family regulator